jgi:CMP-N-acetylneuraminic acid synthetase
VRASALSRQSSQRRVARPFARVQGGDSVSVVAVVPMKLNNERLPGKNTKRFSNGEPLFTYVLNTLLRVEALDNVYVYCSSDSIRDGLPEGVILQKRSTDLDTSQTTMNQILTAFAEDVHADVYLLTHATAPFIRPETFDLAIRAVATGEHDSAFSVRKLQEFLWQDGAPLNYGLDSIPRSQDLPVLFQETTGFYVYTRDLIKSRGRRIGVNPLLVEVSKVEAVDINDAEDFDIADAIFNSRRG